LHKEEADESPTNQDKEINMSNNTRNQENTATYLVQSFVGSERRIPYQLNPYDLTLLFIIARYIDMPLGYCCVKQENLAIEGGMSLRQVKYYRGKLHHYILGEVLTGMPII
jgi:hypothetical protein